jgi:hypothetical protein
MYVYIEEIFFKGTYCQLINPCVYSPCKNNAKCTASFTDNSASYTCTCSPECSGKNCEFCTNACQKLTCLNRGTCILDKNEEAFCACQAGYTGKNCENSK